MKLKATINGQPADLEISDDELTALAVHLSHLQHPSLKRLNQKELAAAMGVSQGTILRWCRQRIIGYARIGRIKEFDLREVQAMRDARTVKART